MAGSIATTATGSSADADPCTIAPLSFAQEALWFLEQLDPGQPVYNVPQAWCLAGPLDVDTLQRSLQLVVDRHGALRTTFGATDGRPYQCVHTAVAVALSVVDLGAVDASLRDAEAMRIAVEAARRPFDLAKGPILRAFLLRLEAARHWLVLVMHHITRDGESMAILRHELSVAYSAFRTGHEPDLPRLPRQWTDYIAWQREQLSEERLKVLLEYWCSRLRDAPTELALPTDRPRPAARSFAGAHELFDVAAPLVSALRALGREEGATLHMTMLSAFQLLLSRHADQDEILIGVPVSGRGRPESEGLVGYFSNTVVIRGDLRGDPSFRELLRRTRQSARDAYAHQDLPLDRLVEAIAPQRDRSRNPLFQVIFTLQDAFHTLAGPLPLDGVESSPVDVETGTAKLDLIVWFARTESGLRAAIEYSTDLFETTTVRRLIGTFLTLLSSIVADPDRPTSRLALLDATERRRMLVDWNATAVAYPSHLPLPELFAETVQRVPAAIAVVDGPRTLTYAELDRRSRQLAYRLLDLGLRPSARVGICIDRSIEEIVAVLGALKAGCVYVPLDPAHPRERLAAVLSDADATAVITSVAMARTLAAFPAINALAIITVETTEPDTAAGRPDPPLAPGGGLAQIIYTSGSTGTPKGVAITHRAIVRLVRGTDYVQLSNDDVVAHVSNPAFDAATFEVFGALLNGGRLVVVARETVLSPAAFAAALESSDVTTLFLTTVLFNQMACDAPTAFRFCRQVLFGGEAVEPRWVKTVLEAGRPQRLLHVYGPTESTTFATWYEVRTVEADASTVPIGRPIANTEVYVLDRHGEPVPIGVPGEICIGGPGLAAGYFGQPQLTAERFVPHPFDCAADARLYRTGDRARYGPDGAIEFLGRFDRQVKIRGHRIEPAEVETSLLRVSGIREAVVLAHGSTSSTRQLTGYIVLEPATLLTPADLYSELRRSIPGYMVPAQIFIVPALPLTPNGKIDRHALPNAGDAAALRGKRRVPPRDPLEHTLALIWEELLASSDIGVHDSFFDIGGHSLLAAQLMDAIERACGCAIPLTTLFTDSTIEQLAQVVRRDAHGSGAPLVALNSGGTRPPFFFLHGDFSGGGFYTRQLARALGPDQPFYAVHPHGLADAQVPETIEAMAADRIHALRIVRPKGPYFLGGHCNGAFVALEIAQQLTRDGEDVPIVIILDALAPWRQERVWPPVMAEEPATTARRPSRTSAETVSTPASNIFGRYRRAMAKYNPAQFSGKIIVLRSQETRDVRRSLGWSKVGEAVETYDVPGNHHTSITRHVATTAGRIAACLGEASGRYVLPDRS